MGADPGKLWDRGAVNFVRDDGREAVEGDKAYAAFQIYLGMGGERTYTKVCQALGKSIPLIKRWASTFKWRDRASAWDSRITESAQEVIVKRTQTEVEQWLKRWEDVDKQDLALGQATLRLVGKIQARVDNLPVVKTEMTREGIPMVVVGIPPALLSSLAALLKTGSDIQRRAILSALNRHGLNLLPERTGSEPQPGSATDGENARLALPAPEIEFGTAEGSQN